MEAVSTIILMDVKGPKSECLHVDASVNDDPAMKIFGVPQNF